MEVSRAERFWQKVDLSGDCWIWTGLLSPTGYGRFAQMLAHRFSYELIVGPIPDGLVLDHLCRNRACVRVEHLEPVTQPENVQRSVGVRKPTTQCPHGHEYTIENTYLPPSGGYKQCRACRKTRSLSRNGV